MAKTEKASKVAELKERIAGSQAMFLTDFRGLTVADVTDLRAALRDSGTRVAVVKNTLMRRAADEAGAADLERLLEGPTAVAFVEGDPIVAAKGLVDAMRRFRTLALKGGFMEGRVLTPAEAESLATIEPREVLLAKLAGLAKAEMARAAFMFQALQSRFLALLEAYREKVPGVEAAASGEAEAETPGGGAPQDAEGEAQPAPEEQEEQPTAEPPEGARDESAPDGQSGGESAPAAEAAGEESAPATEAAGEESAPATEAAGEESEGKE